MSLAQALARREELSSLMNLDRLARRDRPASTTATQARIAVSVIIPAKNEEKNLPILIERLFSVLSELDAPF